MARGNTDVTKVIYDGKNGQSFVAMVDSVTDLENWKKDSSVPLAQVVSTFQVFTTHQQGHQGLLDAVPNSLLENEFGTVKQEECIKHILKNGSTQIQTVCFSYFRY
ncbi:ribosome maturation protein [Pyronema omphalodes]|nr:ribosome maturation protein [Pyronema omphalodes]